MEGKQMSDNIFSGLKVVELASFIAGPSAAVILSDFGADVIKVEPPSGDLWRHGHQIAPQPRSKDPYPFHLANRNKRGITLEHLLSTWRFKIERDTATSAASRSILNLQVLSRCSSAW